MEAASEILFTCRKCIGGCKDDERIIISWGVAGNKEPGCDVIWRQRICVKHLISILSSDVLAVYIYNHCCFREFWSCTLLPRDHHPCLQLNSCCECLQDNDVVRQFIIYLLAYFWSHTGFWHVQHSLIWCSCLMRWCHWVFQCCAAAGEVDHTEVTSALNEDSLVFWCWLPACTPSMERAVLLLSDAHRTGLFLMEIWSNRICILA